MALIRVVNLPVNFKIGHHDQVSKVENYGYLVNNVISGNIFIMNMPSNTYFN
jgi:hypothetical protein